MNEPKPSTQSLGTSSIVVAAFVGPGTVTACAKAGVQFGYSLGWVLIFATAAAFVLQSFTAATGILARRGLGEALQSPELSPTFRSVARTLVVLGLWLGCAAFEMGNLKGAAVGISGVFGRESSGWMVAVLAAASAILLLQQTKVVIRVLSMLVCVMGALFVLTVFASPVHWAEAVRGLLVPSIPKSKDGLLSVIALIGTTVVTYNLFLHASATHDWWKDESNTRLAWRQELRGMAVFIPLGGVVSVAILFCGATVGASIEDFEVGKLPVLLEPIAGSGARCMFGIGMLAAGLTSAVTAPLAAAAGISELFGWKKDSSKFRLVWFSVLLTGLVCAMLGTKPVQAIMAAQVANGILLPLIAGFMLFLSVKQKEVQLPGWYTALGVVITLVCAGLGGRTLWQQLERILS